MTEDSTPDSEEKKRKQDVRLILQELLDVASEEKASEYVNPDCTEFTKQRTLSGTFGDQLGIRIQEGDAILAGGAAIVFQCREKDYDRKVALKVPRPSGLAAGGEEKTSVLQEQRLASAEATKAARLSHTNVCYLVNAEQIGIQPPGHPKYVTTVLIQEWIDEAEPLDDYIYKHREKIDIDTLVHLLMQAFDGLNHLHDRGLVHWDVKEENCLVDRDGNVKVSDFGNAREQAAQGATFDEAADRQTTRRCWPEAGRSELDDSRGSNRVVVQFDADEQSRDRPWLDLYMAGRMIARICGLETAVGIENDLSEEEETRREEYLEEIFDPDDEYSQMALTFLSFVVKRLLTPFEDGLDPEFSVFYENANEVKQDLAKLLHEFGDAEDVEELYPFPQQVIRTPVTDNTEYSDRIEALTKTKGAKRLTHHEQLGLTYFVYPGARHSRFEHMVGTIGTTLQYVRALFADRTNPAFRLLCTSLHIRALIFAAAVHDTGHGAFSHYLEESEALFRSCSHEDYIQAVLRGEPEEYDGFVDETLDDDDPVWQRMAEERKELKRHVEADWIKTEPPHEEDAEEFLHLVADILDPPQPRPDSETDFIPLLTSRKESENAAKWILHSIIDSVLDADKLDYLRRDAEHAGLDYSKGADTDRFFQSLTVALTPGRRPRNDSFRPTIAVNRKGVRPLESLLLARYQVFKSMYWHRIARSVTTILKYLVWRYLVPPRTSVDGDRGKSTFRKRRADLLQFFRESSDKDALEWLLDRVCVDDDHISNSDCGRFRAALTARENLPKPIFDISRGEVQSRWQETSEYAEISREILAAHDRLNELGPVDFSRRRQKILRATCRKIERRLNAELDEREDEHGDRLVRCPDLNPDCLFIDVPLADKDQIENLWVVDRRDRLRVKDPQYWYLDQVTGDGATRPKRDGSELNEGVGSNYYVREFSRFSPMGDDVKFAFKHWARRIRVFVWPDIRVDMLFCTGNDEARLAEIVIESLQEAYEQEAPE